MRITGFRHRSVAVPVKYPVVSSVRQSAKVDFVLLDVMTDEGIAGIAYAQAFNRHGAQAIRACLGLLEEVVVGEDPGKIERIWQKMWKSTKLLGHQGLSTFALSMVDIALWDIAGKAAGQPVFRLLAPKGAVGTPSGSDSSAPAVPALPAYMSDGLWLVTPQEAAAQAAAFAEAGFAAMKMRLGRPSGEDIAAYRAIRRAVGDEVDVMGDVNQGWSPAQALDAGAQLAAEGLSWLEEPVDAEDDEAHAVLTAHLQLAVATGENLYGIRPFRRFLQAHAATVYTPDLQRVGGVTGWLQLRDLFEANNVRHSVHLFPEFAVHLLASAKQPDKLEWMSWASALFQEPLECERGIVSAPLRPGFGMEWNEPFIDSIGS
ncbi:MAG: mandelate racemase [Paenibacillaceae bacterium]|nr:mandelate racemase [Paenibacillaceae bacterium]